MNKSCDSGNQKRFLLNECNLLSSLTFLRRHENILLFVSLLLLLAVRGYSRDKNLYFNISMEHGLSDASVTGIVQDKYGYMWFGTGNGLNRYDAYTIRRFYANEGTGLISNSITSLYCDTKGKLWVGTGRGLAVYDYTKDQFIAIRDSILNNTGDIYCFTEDRKQNLYVGAENGFYYWSRSEDKWINLSRKYKDATTLSLVKDVLIYKDNTLLISTAKKGFYKIDLQSGKVQPILFQLGIFNECCLYTSKLLQLNETTVLSGSLSLGMLKLDLRNDRFSWPVKGGALNGNNTIMYNTVSDMIRDHAGRIWIASHYFGIAEYLPEKDSIIINEPQSFGFFNFTGRSVHCLFEDRQHNIWIGTGEKGVYRFAPNQDKVSYYRQNEMDPSGLQPLGDVVSISGIDEHTLLIGMKRGMSLYDKRTGAFINYKSGAHYQLSSVLDHATCALKDRSGNVWIGSSRLGLMKCDLQKGTFATFTRFSPKPVFADGVTRMLEIGNDSLCLLNFNTITVLNTRTLDNVSVNTDSLHPLLRLTGVSDICSGAVKGTIWLSLYNGTLYQYEFSTHTLSEQPALATYFEKPPAIYKVCYDAGRNELWCATSKGAVCISGGNVKKVYTIRGTEDIFPEIRNIILLNNELWMTNGRSVARQHLITGEQVVLGPKEGFPGLKLFPHSFMLSPWKTIMIGGNHGFLEIFPDKIEDSITSQPAFLTSFNIHGRPYPAGRPMSRVDTISLSYKQNFFSFDMSAFDYSEQDNVEYAYKLEGFDKGWNIIGKSRSGSYTNVPGGTYLLKLKSRSIGGRWNEAGQHIVLIISKPFWQSSWFYFFLIAGSLGVIYLFYRRRINIIKRREKSRSDLEIRMNELENSALRTQMNPHFIFNSLNTINSLINGSEPERANQFISKFSKLIRLTLDHSREKRISLQDEIRVVELYIELEKIRFSSKFEYSIEIIGTIDPELIEIPPMVIQPFVENAILHGLLPLSSGKGNLSVRLQEDAEVLYITIADNGIGRKQSHRNKKHTFKEHKSHGIDITMKRIILFNKEQGCNEEIQIRDLEDDEGNALGTEVILPLKKTYRF